MELKLLNKDRDKLRFVIKNSDNVYANTLRRMIMDEVPVIAIDEVTIVKNTSAIYDEVIAHRLGLVVLKTDLDSYNLRELCKCEGKGCARCQTYLTLNAKGPCTVYAEDLKPKDPKIKPVYPKTILAKLAKGQVLQLEATAILGKGKEHAKFSPALAYYHAYPEIDISNPGAATDVVKVCPTKVFKVENKQAKVVNLTNCILCMACVDACGENVIKVHGSKSDFIFSIESWGQIKPSEIVVNALDLLDDKLDSLAKELKKAK